MKTKKKKQEGKKESGVCRYILRKIYNISLMNVINL